MPIVYAWNNSSNIVYLGLIDHPTTLVALYAIATQALPPGRSVRTLYSALAGPAAGALDACPANIDITEPFDDQQV